MKVFIVIKWFWDGDSYLVNSYLDCFLDQGEAQEFAQSKGLKIYQHGETLPDENDGDYGSPDFIQIIEKTF